MATETVYAFDAISANNPQYTSADQIDWMWQWQKRANGVFGGLDSALIVTSDGIGGVNVASGVCALGGRTYKLSSGPVNKVMTPLPASGFRTAYAIVVRFTVGTATGTIVPIAGSTIANPGPAVNPSIVSATDTLLAYVLAVNTAGTIVYTVTDARTYVNQNSYVQLTSGSPYTTVAFALDTIDVIATTNPYIVNLPQASICPGYALRILNSSTASTGLVKIVPFSGEKIGPMAANVAAYLSNWDQSGFFNTKQSLSLVSDGVGWVVLGGQFNPEPGSVDVAGSQYFLGKLHHLPLGNTTDRRVVSGASTPSSGFSSAVQVTGTVGVPVGAKAVKALAQLSTTSGGNLAKILQFSDNSSSTPANTAHPTIIVQINNQTAGQVTTGSSEIDIPLNSSGQFFSYSSTAGSWTYTVTIMGYYMGD